MIVDGQATDPEDFKTWTVTYANGKQIGQLGDYFDQGIYKLDPTKTPKTIEVVITEGANKGFVIVGIYQLEGDTLRICWAPWGTTEYPKKFDSTAGSKRDLAVLKRAPPPASGSAPDARTAKPVPAGPTWEEFGDEIRVPISKPAPTYVAYSADGKKLIAVIAEDLHQWEHNGALTSLGRKSIRDVISEIRTGSLGHGGELMTVVRNDAAVELWDLATPRRIERIQFPLSVAAMDVPSFAAYSPHQQLLAVAWPGNPRARFLDAIPPERRQARVVLWDVNAQRERTRHYGSFSAVAFSADGGLLAAASGNEAIYVWDVQSGELLTTFGGKPPSSLMSRVVCVTFTPDGVRLAAGIENGTVKIWLVATGQLEAEIQSQVGLSSLAFSPRGWDLAIGNVNATIQDWQRTPWLEDAPLRLGPGRVHLIRVGRIRGDVQQQRFLGRPAVQGQHVYQLQFVRQDNRVEAMRLLSVDVSEPTKPVVVGSCALPEQAQKLVASGRYVYVVASPHLRVVDVSDPKAPREAGSCELGEYVWDLAVQGRYAYVTDLSSVRVVDLENPSAPKEAGRCDVESAQGITAAGPYAYVACDIEGVSIVDISDPAAPRVVGTFDGPQGAVDVAVAGNYPYIAGGEDAVTLWVADVTDPKRPKGVGKFGDWIQGSVVVQGDLAYLAGSDLDVVDISNPAAPKRAGSFPNASDVAVDGDHVYVANDEGFWILRRVSD